MTDRGGLKGPLDPNVLSQDQKQLFSLAQAILHRRIHERKAPENRKEIPLLNEVDSSLNLTTNQEIHRIIQNKFQEYIIIIVSHHLDIVMDFDAVVVIDNGYMVKKGQPQLLLEKEESRFRELWVASRC